MYRIVFNRLILFLVALLTSVLSLADTLNVVLYDRQAPPLFFKSNNSESGIYIDLLTEIGVITGHKFKYEYYPTKRAMVMFEKGDAHIEVGINPLWRSTSAVPGKFTIAFANAEDVVVFRKENFKTVARADDLYGDRVGTINGFYYPGYMEGFASGKILRKDSLGEDKLLLKLFNRRLDAMFIRKEVVLYQMKMNDEYKDLKIGSVINSADIMIRIHPSKQSVLDSINSAIEALKNNGKIDEIYARYR